MVYFSVLGIDLFFENNLRNSSFEIKVLGILKFVFVENSGMKIEF